MVITAHASVDEFFHEVVVEALDSLSLETTAQTEYYLVGLLGDFAKARISDEPLFLKLAQAVTPEERVRALKEVGDTSLYVTGFFAESFERKLIDVDYYIGMGEAAYGELAGRLDTSAGFREIYEELACKFPRFVDLLGVIRNRVNIVGNDVVQLYRRWLETRSDWIEKRMRTLGLIVTDKETVH